MKKILSILLFSFYLLFSLGLVLSFHYCSGNLASINVIAENNCCCEEESEKTDDCCKNEIKTLKITLDQIQTKSIHDLNFSFNFIPLTTKICFSLNPFYVIQQHKIIDVNPIRPPIIANQIPIFKKINAYLFYS